VVYLHGCLQTAEAAAKQTRFNELARKLRFVVAYPDQRVTTDNRSAPFEDGNGIGCWNWFLPEDQERELEGDQLEGPGFPGEPALIAGITRQVMATQRIDPARVYVDGISAGADMAVIMGATYPDLYAAVGALAGGPYATWTDLTGRLTYDAMGPRARVVPMFVEQGTADTLNAFPVSQALVDSWLGAGDLADDGEANGSIARTPAKTENHDFDQTPQPASGDACVRNHNWPCPGGVIGFQDTYPYTVESYADSRGCDVLDFWVVHGLEHAYPNADPSTEFSDPLGPDITTAAYRFFMAHPMTHTCPKP
jgi:poly(hydroxyalkanoate) depolymerase family esterase